MKKSWFGFVFCAVFFAALWCSAMDALAAEELPEKCLRLHVLAAGDSEGEQARKLAVRDAVLELLTPALEGCADREEAARRVEALLPEVEAAARQTLRELGSDESVTATLSRETYPVRSYPGFALPAGTYESLRVILGAGEGHNWWCVVFPPLCLSAVEEDGDRADDAWAVFSPEEQRLITGEGRVLRFRVLEWWQRMKELLG